MTRVEHVMVGMSGGVDSSVSAMRLRDQGLSVAGLFMKNWEEEDRFGTCPAEQDAADARAVAEHLDIPFFARNFAAEYWDQVFEHFLAEYRAGRTPNPDILCNREIKFKTFLEHAEDLGASHIATGHYARVDERDGRYRLLRGRDHNKDQSYFLYTLGQEQLARTLFPIGEMEKPAVRDQAEAAGLAIFDKKDSTGICFIGERDFRGFLARYLEAPEGPMRTPEGDTVGTHVGLMHYTLGQRKGLGIGGVANADDAAWYVLGKDLDHNILYVGQGHDHPWLFSTTLEADELSWVAGDPPAVGKRVGIKTRYRQRDRDGVIEFIRDGSMGLRFEQPQRAVTPGQSVVLYDGDECLGGGVIETSNAEWQ